MHGDFEIVLCDNEPRKEGGKEGSGLSDKHKVCRFIRGYAMRPKFSGLMIIGVKNILNDVAARPIFSNQIVCLVCVF